MRIVVVVLAVAALTIAADIYFAQQCAAALGWC